MTYNIRMPEDKDVKYTQFYYPAGETQIRLMDSELESVAGADKIVVFCNTRHFDMISLALLTNALEGANKGCHMVLVLPYLPYGRADRRFVNGDCDGLGTFGNLIDTLRYSYVITLDAHSPMTRRSISNFVNVSPEPFVREAIKQMHKEYGTDFTILLPDKGADRYRVMLHNYKVKVCEKVRDPETGLLGGFKVPNISTTAVLIVDDICDGGGTFLGIAKELRKQNVYDLHLYVTHGIFSKGLEALGKVFKTIFTTDSFDPVPDNQLTILPTVKLLNKEANESN